MKEVINNTTENTLTKEETLLYWVILGASSNPERYSYQAFHLSRENGLEVLGVHPSGKSLGGETVFKTLAEAREFITARGGKVDVMSVYVSKDIALTLAEEIAELTPRRIILNPGADDPAVSELFKEKGLSVVEACTLVLLRTGQHQNL